MLHEFGFDLQDLRVSQNEKFDHDKKELKCTWKKEELQEKCMGSQRFISNRYLGITKLPDPLFKLTFCRYTNLTDSRFFAFEK